MLRALQRVMMHTSSLASAENIRYIAAAFTVMHNALGHLRKPTEGDLTLPRMVFNPGLFGPQLHTSSSSLKESLQKARKMVEKTGGDVLVVVPAEQSGDSSMIGGHTKELATILGELTVSVTLGPSR